ncbi:hypothetical protein QBC47DRAFT_396218 [Echria macrotheca]|uniref:Uncharacterized protein n=1 Tax=Echria macrotheca TaxID=438768 RepID=A0AAJ0BN10_9PEZI|nr:hypothetical protein QBC47DRAFT_396218 [Echria macrotheca]
MTALAQFAYMVPLIAALGQLRWLRARDPRTLSEFVALDQAARGYANILPALLGRGGIMAVVGGLLIVLGLLVFPATQQAIGYRTGLVPGQETATAARLVSLTEGHDIIGDWRKAAALQQAVLGSSASSKTSGGITCPTGDCAFPLFTSLAVCSRTSNITSMLTVGREPDQRWTGTNSTTTYSGTLPGGLSLVTPNRASLGFGVPSSPRPVSDKSPALVLLDLYAVYTTPGPDERNAPTFSAAEVVFSWCIQQISADVSAGVVTLATTPIDGTLVGDGGRNVSLAAQFQSAGNARNTTICLPGAEPQSSACSHGVNVTLRTTTETDQDELFTIGQVQSLRLSRTLAQIFGGIDRPIPRGGDFFIPTDSSDNSLLQLDGNTASLMAAKFATTIFNTTATVPSDSSRAGEGIQTTAETIASSISHLLRTDPSAAEDVTGTTLTHSTIIAVTWPWLSFIVAEVVGVALFLTIVAIQTRRADIPVLKTDTLATMLALDGDVRKVLGAAVATAGEMRDWAGRLNVVLERDMESGRNHNGGGPVSLAAVKDAAFASLTFAGGSRGWVRVK